MRWAGGVLFRQRQDDFGVPTSRSAVVIAVQGTQRLHAPPAILVAANAVEDVPAVGVALIRPSNRNAILWAGDQNGLGPGHLYSVLPP